MPNPQGGLAAWRPMDVEVRLRVLRQTSLFLWGPPSFFPSGLQLIQLRPICILEGNLFYSKSSD